MADEIKEEINKEQMKKEMEDIEEEEFSMSEEEAEEAKKGNFNTFWSTKEMEYDKLYKFRIASDKMTIRKIEDKYAGEPTDRMILAIEELETGMLYDLTCYKNKNKKGNYSSLTQAMRRLHALTDGKLKDTAISIVKGKYNHPDFGDTDSFAINIITAEPEQTA